MQIENLQERLSELRKMKKKTEHELIDVPKVLTIRNQAIPNFEYSILKNRLIAIDRELNYVDKRLTNEMNLN